MEYLLPILILAFAVSIDSLGIGMTYGMRQLQISTGSLVLIGFCSFIAALLSGSLAQVLFNYIPPQYAEYLGGAILIGIGLWAIYRTTKPQDDAKRSPSTPVQKPQEETKVNWEIKRLGLVFKVLRKPTAADMDSSGTISIKEALILGIALGLDAFAAGFGAAMLGYSIIVFAIFVFVICMVFLVLGKKGGFKLADRKFIHKLAFLPGLLIVCIGILEFI